MQAQAPIIAADLIARLGMTTARELATPAWTRHNLPVITPANFTDCCTLFLFDVPTAPGSFDTYTATYNTKTNEVRVFGLDGEPMIDPITRAIVHGSMRAWFEAHPNAFDWVEGAFQEDLEPDENSEFPWWRSLSYSVAPGGIC